MEESARRESVVITGACNDCGGRCVHRVHTSRGGVVRMETDDGDEPQYRSCLKGRAYRQRVYASDRLGFPMRRVGARGEGKFERVSWDEALDTVAGELKRVKGTCGPSAILYISGTAQAGHLHAPPTMHRLLNLFGGCTVRWGSPSAEGCHFAAKATYHVLFTEHSRDDLVNSRLILMWGWDPAVTTHGTKTAFYLVKAKEAGARIVAIDPMLSASAAAFADRWIPIIPGTDTAMMLAMAYVMITDGLQDQRFIDTYTYGFDVFRDYLLGRDDGIPKTPSWAEGNTGVPARTIQGLAREFAIIKPGALMSGRAPGRTAYGEQYHRAAATLAAMTGNIGIHGGNPAGLGLNFGRFAVPAGRNPVESGAPPLDDTLDVALKSCYRIANANLWDAIIKGRSGGYPADFKLLYTVGGNCLNSYLDINKGVEALRKLEFIVVHENSMTATARFADILLPVCTHMEQDDVYRPGYPAPYYIFGSKVVEPLTESKSDFEIAAALAPRLGITDYTDKDEDGWLRDIVRRYGEACGDIPDFDEFKRKGVHKYPLVEPIVSFKAEIDDPVNHPFPTPSGKIEIYSRLIADLKDPRIPAIPTYLPTWENRNDPLANKYPLQLISTHAKQRANSVLYNVPWLNEVEPQKVIISVSDARERGVQDGDLVTVFNDRGKMVIRAAVTERIMPGVVCIPEGAPYMPDEHGVDTGGSPNVLTRDAASPAGAFCTNTALVQVEKARQRW